MHLVSNDVMFNCRSFARICMNIDAIEGRKAWPTIQLLFDLKRVPCSFAAESFRKSRSILLAFPINK